jgi:NAD(P)H-hydrate epimerase
MNVQKGAKMRLPTITTQQMMEVDQLMVEEYGIQLIQMMENAGRNMAELSRQLLGGDVRGKRIAVLCGAGNNGGGGMVAARHLHNWGAKVFLKLFETKNQIKAIPALQRDILACMGLSNRKVINLERVDLVLDAMIGYGLTGNPRGSIADWIRRVNESNRPVLALDTPSGLDTTTGSPGEPCLRATATLTLALPKSGLVMPAAAPYVGNLYLADIGVPPQLYARLGIKTPPIFIHETIINVKPYAD